MNTYTVLIVICSLVIFSYLFDLFARHTKFQAVLLLLGLGAVLRQLAMSFDIKLPDMSILLPVLGNIGVILIVFEGAMDLKFSKSKLPLIGKSFYAAFWVMVLSIGLLSTLFYYLLDCTVYQSILNAIPYGVISSAIAIPSVSFLSEEKREFVVYESSFSDILGIVFFNYFIVNSVVSFPSVFALFSETVFLLILSVLFCFFLMYLMKRITHRVKFFLIISIMILAYATGKQYHLSTLIVVLVFGFFLGNQHLVKWPFFNRNFQYDDFHSDFEQLENVSAESAFLVRTFFFLLFGFTIDPSVLANMEVLKYGGMVLAILYFVRFVYLKWVAKADLLPELFVNPRGLISVLLFMAIPAPLLHPTLGNGLLVFVVLASSLVMMFGLLAYRKN
jgi:hypothetical protein